MRRQARAARCLSHSPGNGFNSIRGVTSLLPVDDRLDGAGGKEGEAQYAGEIEMGHGIGLGLVDGAEYGAQSEAIVTCRPAKRQ